MLDKKLIKDIQSLSVKKYRQEQGLFVAEGPKIVGELLELIPQRVLQVYAIKEWSDVNPGCSAQVISSDMLSRISQLQTPNMVLAVCKQPVAAEPSPVAGWCLYLDGLQDPGNLGTIIRTADWFGIPSVVCSAECADAYNPKVVQATMGSIARVTIWYDEGGDWLLRQSLPLFAASLTGRSIFELERQRDGILVIGNESKGVRKDFLAIAEQLTIPRRGAAESLNAAVAAGIIIAQVAG
ncbi:MAG: RNA methyltransferase [Chitinophagaceae bacterium]